MIDRTGAAVSALVGLVSVLMLWHSTGMLDLWPFASAPHRGEHLIVDITPAPVTTLHEHYCNSSYPSYETYHPLSPLAKLLQVHVFHRHGDRAPSRNINPEPIWNECDGIVETLLLQTSDEDQSGRIPRFTRRMHNPGQGDTRDYRNGMFWEGNCYAGQLTRKGVEQMRALGRGLQSVYVDPPNGHSLWIDGEKPDIGDVAIRSTDVWRTIQSAQFLASAMFPSADPLHPVEIEIRPVQVDSLTVSELGCPRLQEIMKTLKGKGTPYDHYYAAPAKQLASQFDAILSASGIPLERYFDMLMCRSCNDKPRPCHPANTSLCITDSHVQHVMALASNWMQYEYTSGGSPARIEAARLRVGPLLKELLDRMQAATHSTSRLSAPRLFLYSGHDTTIGALLYLLQAADKRWPGYAANVAVELWQDGDGRWVRILFNGRPVKALSCDYDRCGWPAFLEYCKPFLPSDIDRECGSMPVSETRS
ncbi:histidine phosphatase superfamily [Polychytrium aggregatum]|uniref:histidine phosphatase superfamily n=1 Tax=Polychytrium aggregatum TaxID=110093 RepID=UPI0022FE2583|nr:histidine phosphatase superfamily [Polychytrium aggregatum]KAI9197217.1 histidine phosphatase superfamily [Polychytrium aggregatum]